MTRTQATIQHVYDSVIDDGVILCIRFGPGVDVVDACRAAVGGGLRVLEITLTTPDALHAIETMAADHSLIVGGGTVLSVQDARDVASAGGKFALSPVFDPDMMDEARRLGLLAVPGASTPREILAAHLHGAHAVKVFPAAALGGPDYLRAVRGPLPNVPLIPTSGPSSDTIADYFAAGAVAVGVGSEVFPPGFTPNAVEKAARRVRSAVDDVRGKEKQ